MMKIHFNGGGEFLKDKNGRELREGDRVRVDFNNLVGTIVFGAIANGHPNSPGVGYLGFFIEWDDDTPASLKCTRNDITWWAPFHIEVLN